MILAAPALLTYRKAEEFTHKCSRSPCILSLTSKKLDITKEAMLVVLVCFLFETYIVPED